MACDGVCLEIVAKHYNNMGLFCHEFMVFGNFLQNFNFLMGNFAQTLLPQRRGYKKFDYIQSSLPWEFRTVKTLDKKRWRED